MGHAGNRTMSKEPIHEYIEELKAEIQKIPSEEQSAKLNSLVDEVERLAETDEKNSILDSVQQSIESFEVEHPKVTSILNRISDALSRMGI